MCLKSGAFFYCLNLLRSDYLETKITVVDAMMGSGKTSWAIQYMNEHAGSPFVFITPYLDEIERIKTCTRIPFRSPENHGDGKLADLKILLARGENVAATHQLFLNSDNEVDELFQKGEYTLILDEELDVVRSYADALCGSEREDFKMRKDDILYMQQEHLIEIDGGKTGFVRWGGQYDVCDFKYSRVREFAKRNSLICVDGTALFWMYPHTVFEAFKEIYVMTYQFEGTCLSSYFRFFDMPIIKMSVAREGQTYRICPYTVESDKELRKNAAALVDIVEAPNYKELEGHRLSKFSKGWYEKAKRKDIEGVKKCFETVRRNYLKASTKELMWTVFKEVQQRVKGSGSTWAIPEYEAKRIAKEGYGITGGEALERFLRKYQCFVPLNARATNDFADRTKLAYMCNIYPNPDIQKFFHTKGCGVDGKLYATNMMIQWIWRSAIRNGCPIQIFILSVRMKNLLKEWLSVD